MSNRRRAIVFGLLVGAFGLSASAAPDADLNQVPGRKDSPVELTVRVTGGEPAKPVPDAEVSLKGPDGTFIEDSKRTDKKGEARFRQLAKGEVTIVVIATSWKTFKVTRSLAKPRETADVVLQALD